MAWALLDAGCGESGLSMVPAAPGEGPDTGAPADLGPGDQGGAAEDAGLSFFDAAAADQGSSDVAFADGGPTDGANLDAAAPDAAGQDAGIPADAGPSGIGPTCFPAIWDPNTVGPNYDQFAPQVGSHCLGTNHQTITGVERVVFLGDSVTVGTPPTPSDQYYRSRLAERLATHFGLMPPSDVWERASLVNGTALVQSSGDFASCAKWGARTDDLIEDNSQMLDCFPESERHKRTLVVMTIGGNDIAAITKAGAPSGGKTYVEVEAMTQEFVQKLRDAVHWLKDDPTLFPNGVDVIFSNMYEFTDATGDVTSCPAAGLAGFDEPWSNPQDLEHLVVWANEQFMQIAVETQTDLIMMLEHFCGHGYHNDDPNGRCYRGTNTERWFDLSCIHPNPAGHQVIADMFMAVVVE
ncbi:MAG: hypothetical protein IPG45_22140 [Deltaproteobacteria bacterium]|nr:hypothetical protein [Deltaproteobacteria bacterium]